MRKKSLQVEKEELKKNQGRDEALDYVPGSQKDRVKTITGEVRGLEKTSKLKKEKLKDDKKGKSK